MRQNMEKGGKFIR